MKSLSIFQKVLKENIDYNNAILERRLEEVNFKDNTELPTINPINMLLFFQYITKRHTIYKKRFIEKLPPPWTDDPILQKYKFTNVFRDLDPGTSYFINKIIPACHEYPEEMIFNAIIYRLYNKIQTFESIGIQNPKAFDKKLLEQKLREIKNSNIPVFTNAFTVSGYNWVNPDNDKITNTCTLIEWIVNDLDSITTNIMSKKDSKNTYNVLLSIKGIGRFLAYQIAVDLGYWNKDVFDESKFTVAGPGCRNGIDRIYSSKSKYSYEECIRYTCQIQDDWFKKIGIDPNNLFSDRNEKYLNLMAMENCFCEISKYLKAYYGEGRPRNHFKLKGTLKKFIDI